MNVFFSSEDNHCLHLLFLAIKIEPESCNPGTQSSSVEEMLTESQALDLVADSQDQNEGTQSPVFGGRDPGIEKLAEAETFASIFGKFYLK